MRVITDFKKENIDQSLQTTDTSFGKHLNDSMVDLANDISSVLSNSLEAYNRSNGKLIAGVEILENLTKTLDDIIMRSPYSLTSSPILLDTYWSNQMAKHKIELLREWLNEQQPKPDMLEKE